MENNSDLIFKMIEKIDLKIDKIHASQIEQGIVQAENTVVLKQHEQRSTKLEDWVSKLHGSNIALEEKVSNISNKVNSIEESESNTKQHIEKINTYLSFFKAVPTLLKSVVLIIGFVSAAYGTFKFFYKG